MATGEPGQGPGVGTVIPQEETKTRTRHCPMYKVFLHNDDITPMEFVVGILLQIFHLQRWRSVKVMLEAHTTGVAFVTALPLEQAEFRVEQAHSLARGRGYPLTFSYELE